MQARHERSLRLATTKSIKALQGRDYDTTNNAAPCGAKLENTSIRRFRYATPTVMYDIATAWLS